MSLSLHLDRRRTGTTHSDRMQHLLGACHKAKMYRIDKSSIQPRVIAEVKAVEVVETPLYWKYGLKPESQHLDKARGMAAQFAYVLNLPRVFVEVEGDVRVCPRATGDERRPAYL